MGAANKLIGKAMALRVDAEMWWLAVEEHHRKYIYEMYLREIERMRPWWIPERVWTFLHKRTLDF